MITAAEHPPTVGWSQSIAVPGRSGPLVVGGEINAHLFEAGRQPYPGRELRFIADHLMTLVARSIEAVLACEAKPQDR
jgi:hypothetical protein